MELAIATMDWVYHLNMAGEAATARRLAKRSGKSRYKSDLLLRQMERDGFLEAVVSEYRKGRKLHQYYITRRSIDLLIADMFRGGYYQYKEDE